MLPTKGLRGIDSDPFVAQIGPDGSVLVARSSAFADGWKGFPDLETRLPDLEIGPGGVVLKRKGLLEQKH